MKIYFMIKNFKLPHQKHQFFSRKIYHRTSIFDISPVLVQIRQENKNSSLALLKKLILLHLIYLNKERFQFQLPGKTDRKTDNEVRKVKTRGELQRLYENRVSPTPSSFELGEILSKVIFLYEKIPTSF